MSCAGDGMIHFTDLDRESTFGQFQFDCHAGTTYEVHLSIRYLIYEVHFKTEGLVS